MINIQEALQIREKWQIFYYLLSSQRKIAPDKIAHFSIIQKQFGKSISSSLFLFFLSQHILTFLVYFTKFRLFDGCYPIGPWGAEMYLTANKFRNIKISLFAQYIIFFSNIIQSKGNSLLLILKFNSLIRVCMLISYLWQKYNNTLLRDCD